MKLKYLVALGFVVACNGVFAVDKTIDKSGRSHDPVVCENYIKSTLELLEKTKPEDARRIHAVKKNQGSCAARDELQKTLGIFIP